MTDLTNPPTAIATHERTEAFKRLHDNLASAPHDAVKCFVSLDDHRAILATHEALTEARERIEAAFREGYAMGVISGGNQGVEWPQTAGKALSAAWKRSDARQALTGTGKDG